MVDAGGWPVTASDTAVVGATLTLLVFATRLPLDAWRTYPMPAVAAFSVKPLKFATPLTAATVVASVAVAVADVPDVEGAIVTVGAEEYPDPGVAIVATGADALPESETAGTVR